MHTRGNQRESVWAGRGVAGTVSFPSLEENIAVDVAVVGGGIAGVTAALLLKRAGRKVALLEQARIGSGDTGRTTAHLTQVLDTRYFDLAEDFGEEGARLASESSRAAIDRIETFTRQLGIDCGFERIPAFLFAETRLGVRQLKRELRAARKIGLPATLVREVPFPGPKIRAALRFENQAQFDPLRYLTQLVRSVEGEGCRVFENTQVNAIEDGEPCLLTTPRGTVTAKDVIVLTHSPVSNRIVLHTKIAPYRSYAIAVRTRYSLQPGLYWDTADPYHYVRRLDDLLIVGGEDHKTGMDEDASARFGKLEAWTRERFDVASVEYRWSAQVHEPVDGLPYIGRNPLSDHLYVGTGFSGNGMTFGTLSGMMLSDEVLGIENPWSGLYQPSRIKPLASAAAFVHENAEVAMCYVGDRLASPEATLLSQIPPGQGKLMKVEGKRLAVYRGLDGSVRACSAVCPHLGGLVRWNGAESSWDCPCHGSRFDTDGKVLNGPSASDLAVVPLEEVGEVGKKVAA